MRRPERESRLRHPRAAGLLHGEGDAEVRYQRVAPLQQDVLRLDVAVDDAQPMRVAQRIGHLARDAQGVVDGQLPLALEARAQRLAGHERHHVVQQSVGLTRIEQRQDMRVLQPCCRADLGEKALAA